MPDVEGKKDFMHRDGALREKSGSWQRFFSEQAVGPVDRLCMNHVRGRTILVTGAGGWIGSALCASLARHGAKHLLLLDHSESGLYEVHREMAYHNALRATPILGSVCDAVLLSDILSRFRPEVIYHSAAYKHVPLAEQNPFAVIENNALGTEALVRAAAGYQVSDLIMVSTDKAVAPASIMGVSKRIGELALLRHNHGGTMRVLRLGNVFGSHGSVAPLFRMQIDRGGPVTVTDPEARRYFMTLQEATGYLLAALHISSPAALFVPELGDPRNVSDLARAMIGDIEVPLVFDGLRPGDKMEEAFFAKNELRGDRLPEGLYPVDSPQPQPDILDNLFKEIRSAIHERNLKGLIAAVCAAVPEYTPSASIREQLLATAEVTA
jgi:FlaA1/EpsC-like NDP-sugar epimerase